MIVIRRIVGVATLIRPLGQRHSLLTKELRNRGPARPPKRPAGPISTEAVRIHDRSAEDYAHHQKGLSRKSALATSALDQHFYPSDFSQFGEATTLALARSV